MRSRYRGNTATRAERTGSIADGNAGEANPNEPREAGSAMRSIVLAIALFVITFGIFLSTRAYQFLSWDDKFNIVTNSYMNGPNGPDYGTYWHHAFLFTYRPLIYDVWSFIAAHARLATPQFAPGIGDYLFDSAPFHLFNIVVHSANAVLAFLVLRMLVKNDWAACAGALLFGVHPLQDESVAWITGGNEVLYGFFALLALWQYLCFAHIARAAKEVKRTGGDGQAGRNLRRQWLHYGAATFFFALALVTKPTAVCLPLIALALYIWAVRRPPIKSVLAIVPWFAAAIAWVFVTATARQLDTTVAHTALWVRPFVAGDAISFYLYKLILPFNLAMEYGRNPDFVMAHPWVYLTFLVPIGLGVLLVIFRRRCPLLLAGFLVFIAALLPTIGLVPNNYQFYSTVSDHYMYLALFGPAMAVAWLLSRARASKSVWISAGACVVFLAYFGTLAAGHARDYRNDETLYVHTIAANPMSWVSHYNYGRFLADQGKLDEAAKQLQAAIDLKPDMFDAYNNLGVTLAALGRDQEALALLQKAASSDPERVFYWVSLGQQYEKLRRYPDAVAAYESALHSDPNNPECEFHVGMVLSSVGQYADSAAHLTHELELAPGNPVAENNLALDLARLGKISDAIPHWQTAIKVQPNYPDAHYNYGVALENLKRTPEAIAEYQAAARLDPQSPFAGKALARLAPSGRKQ